MAQLMIEKAEVQKNPKDKKNVMASLDKELVKKFRMYCVKTGITSREVIEKAYLAAIKRGEEDGIL